MKPLLILGAGAFALEALDIAEQTGGFQVEGFVTSTRPPAPDARYADLPVFWIDDLPMRLSECFLVCGIGSTGRREFIEIMLDRGYRFASVIHPSAVISPRCTIEDGCLINAGVVISHSAYVGTHVLLNRGCLIGHDTRIGSFCTVGPGANIAGGVEVGSGVYIGIGAIIRDHVSVGAGSVIAAGSVVVKPVAPNTMVGGSPARRVNASST